MNKPIEKIEKLYTDYWYEWADKPIEDKWEAVEIKLNELIDSHNTLLDKVERMEKE